MGIQVALNHRTQYRYDKAVSLGPQVVQLRPAPHGRTPILNYQLTVLPTNHRVNWQLDLHGNYLARLVFSEKTKQFVVEVDLLADLSPVNPFDFLIEPGYEEYPFRYAAETARELEPFLARQDCGPLFKNFVDGICMDRRPTLTFLGDLNRSVCNEIAYVTRLDPGIQSCEQTMVMRSGSCRDSAWLLVQLMRKLGIAARFVSGYLIQLTPDDPTQGGPKADSADLHAWTEVYLPGAGWIGMDPTSGLFAAEGHIPLVAKPNASMAAPIGGTVEPTRVDLEYSMSVRRVNEVARTSRPLNDEAWTRVNALGREIDAELAAGDVRLTMGGEPTFVGIDEPDHPQWHIEAHGAEKRARGLALIQGLSREIAPGAMLHYGQGKWYPGEALPRWALSCYWREDGVAVWEDATLIAKEDTEYGFSSEDARQFAAALARRLEVDPADVLPAFNPGSESEEPAGYILPTRRRQHEERMYWSSQLWFPRPARLTLTAGDSPIGYRISTETIPWVVPDDLKYEHEAEPFADRVKLPAQPRRRPELFERESVADPLPALSTSSEASALLIRPALCVEARQGRLHVFFPFAAKLADYLDLVAAVEDACQHQRQPVWLEGYAPPADARLKSFSVTPDPGVLEVNLPPAKNWAELERINGVLFEVARANRLGAEKFAYDGSHIATGGGSHIVIGGATLEDSPLLRRPDLLAGMVRFWQHHPSLSYLFSGMYVGPTSQCPRVDEARMDALYELEVAFAQLSSKECSREDIDGLFRNLFVDVTGNTHRAEFCIDKLYAPDGRGLRLGLLELRAFEMAPHLRMSLLQMLLVRGLVCMLWKHPYKSGLARWGTALNDRFMLPHFVWADFEDVLAALRQSDLKFEAEWFAAQFEFRFPRIGSIRCGDVELELRQALEPWNVLAEETVGGGTMRTVDSSLERIQVKVMGPGASDRYAVLCNGRMVPLHVFAQAEAAGGVRFRARKLSASLHPTIPVHAPLVFDMVDRWSERSVARCIYHAIPPDGRIYAARPKDALEAELRRKERFEVSVPPSDHMAASEEDTNADFPTTLDLRWPAQASQAASGKAE